MEAVIKISGLKSPFLWGQKKIGDKLRQKFVSVLRLVSQNTTETHQFRSRSKPLDVIGALSNLLTLWNDVMLNNKQHLKGDSPCARYFRDFQMNLLVVLERMKNLFSSPRCEAYFHRNSKLSINIIYIHAELAAIFPGGVFNEQYTFAKTDAGVWWRSMFNSELHVRWPEFLQKFATEFQVTDSNMINKLHDTLSFSSEYYVSVFSMDLFSRLFAPWHLLMQVWTKLVYEHPGYMAWTTFDGMRQLLDRYKLQPGTYAFRMSCTNIGFWSVGSVSQEGAVMQTICRSQYLADFLEEGIKKKQYLQPVGSRRNTDLGELTSNVLKYPVTARKMEDYSSRASFEICGICMNNSKNTQLEPCQHLICSSCCKKWMNRSNQCPFCRRPVCSISTIRLEFDDAETSPSSVWRNAPSVPDVAAASPHPRSPNIDCTSPIGSPKSFREGLPLPPLPGDDSDVGSSSERTERLSPSSNSVSVGSSSERTERLSPSSNSVSDILIVDATRRKCSSRVNLHSDSSRSFTKDEKPSTPKEDEHHYACVSRSDLNPSESNHTILVRAVKSSSQVPSLKPFREISNEDPQEATLKPHSESFRERMIIISDNYNHKIDQLMEGKFSRDDATQALEIAKGDMDIARSILYRFFQ